MSDRKINEKPLPNYLKPTISSSRPDQVKFLKKNNALEENQKLIRRQSFDRPLSSLTSSSSSSSRKSLNISPRDIPMIPLRRPVKSLPVVSKVFPGAKKSGLRSKKEGSKNVPKKSSDKEITPESSPLVSAHKDEEEIVQVSDHREKPKEEDKGILINEDKTEEPKENIQENNIEDKEELENKLDEEETTYESKIPKEVVQGNKQSPTLYNNVIASKIQNLEKMNVMAFARAFQTVIDYETAASK